MNLIIGLGNPGKKYEKTRHNIGFRILDSICDDWSVMKKCSALICKQENIIYAKPQTYMNLSGTAIVSLAEYYKIYDTNNILMVYDDKDLPLGTIRYRSKGSAGGHKGVLSTIEHLRTEEIPRLKIGIAPNNEKIKIHDTADFVLSKFSSIEEKEMPDIISQAKIKIENFIK